MSFSKSEFAPGRLSSLFVILVLLIGCCLPAQGQMLNRKQLSQLGLSAAEQKELTKRLKLFVEYEKAGAYDKQFELLAQDHLASLVRLDVNKQSYVKFKQETEAATGKLLDLKVKSIERMPDRAGGFTFTVEVERKKEGRNYSDVPIFAGFLVNGTWYFSMVNVSF